MERKHMIISKKNSETAILIVLLLSMLFPLMGEEISLSEDEAVRKALDRDWRIQSAFLDQQAARAQEDKAFYDRWMPSVALAGGYTRLSHVTSAVSLGGASFDMDSQDDSFSLTGNLNYTVFAGFRLKEAQELAGLQVKGKDISLELTRQAVSFETKRAYWEAFRAANNTVLMEQNLALVEKNRDLVRKKVESGTLLKADLLSAEMRCDQARMDLEQTRLFRDKAYLNLAMLTGNDNSEAIPDYQFSTAPERDILTDLPGNDELVGEALAERPESRAAELAVRITETSRDLSRSSLSPVLAVTGNYTYANPNSRVFLQSDPQFTGTWYAGISLSYDVGRLPSRLSEAEEKETQVEKSRTDLSRRLELIVQDVRNCRLSYELADRNIDRVSHMLEQARENERVAEQKVNSGTAEDIDLLGASLARLKAEYAIVNCQIDRQIAAADLIRAAALTGIGGE